MVCSVDQVYKGGLAQGKRYAQLYLDRLRPVLRPGAGKRQHPFPIDPRGRALPRPLDGLRGCDPVTYLKTRRERRERIHGEVRAKPSDIVRVVDS
jgi:hypothetical protein